MQILQMQMHIIYRKKIKKSVFVELLIRNTHTCINESVVFVHVLWAVSQLTAIRKKKQNALSTTTSCNE